MTDSDDGLETGKMSFLDHLDELRRRLIHTAIALGILFAISWFFSDRIYNFLERPVKQALREAYVNTINGQQQNSVVTPREGEPYLYTFQVPSQVQGVTIPAGTTIPAEYKKSPDGTKLILVTSTPWIIGNSKEIAAGYELPTSFNLANAGSFGPEEKLVIDTVAGGFNLYVRVSFYFAVFLGVPFLLYQIWSFIAPGLYQHEKAYAWPVIIMGSLFFLLGASFAYTVAFPRACDYLIGLSSENFRPLIRADDYFDIVTTILLGLGLVFQIPTLTFVLSRVGLVTPRLILRTWRYAIMVIMIAAALLSPTPDIPNMLVFALPMIALYFLSVGIAWVFGKARRVPEESTEIAGIAS